MNEIHPIGTLASFNTLKGFSNQSSNRFDSGNTAVLDDSVEISELAQFLSRLSELPEARARKIMDIRNAIQNNAYEAPEKLDIAAERLLSVL
jgi:hypothetical protein